jgi:hypothetical protein
MRGTLGRFLKAINNYQMDMIQLKKLEGSKEIFPSTKKADKKITKLTFKPTDEERALVEQMSSVGIPQESIGLVIRDGIDDKTLRKHFRRELDTAAIRANAAVAGALYKSALEGGTQAAIWWTKTRMKWSDKQEIEHSGNAVWTIQNIYEA